MAVSKEYKKLNSLLSRKNNLTAMLAPSFIIDFPYPQIIGMLKRLGFKNVVEVALGARITNQELTKEITKNPAKKFITSPCPNIYQMVAKKFPHLKKYLSLAPTPMIATARIVLQKYPTTKPVFIGPCLVKKLEAKRFKDLNILAVTFKDLFQIFKDFNINNKPEDNKYKFDLVAQNTRVYPVSGGLAESAFLENILKKDQYLVVSGPKQAVQTLNNFEKNINLKVLDILFCKGGCINGLGIINTQQTLKTRKQKILSFWNQEIYGNDDLENF